MFTHLLGNNFENILSFLPWPEDKCDEEVFQLGSINAQPLSHLFNWGFGTSFRIAQGFRTLIKTLNVLPWPSHQQWWTQRQGKQPRQGPRGSWLAVVQKWRAMRKQVWSGKVLQELLPPKEEPQWKLLKQLNLPNLPEEKAASVFCRHVPWWKVEGGGSIQYIGFRIIIE